MDIWEKLKSEKRPIVLYGTGNGADKIIDILERENIKISGIFSSSAFVRDRVFRGYKVTSYEVCKELFPEMLILMCFGSSRIDVIENIKVMMQKNELIAPEVPVYGDYIFNEAFYEEHKTELAEVRNALYDEKSKYTFDKLISYKLTGNISYLFEAEHEKHDIVEKNSSFQYIDLGAYNGDTVTEFNSLYTLDKIIAVEPDKRNFRKLRENTGCLKNISFYNALISDNNSIVFLDNNKGRGAHESSDGKLEIQALTVDSIAEKEKLSLKEQLLIKFDVEGNEFKAIEGASKTIKKYTPIMFISCYHRSEDYFTIPFKVLSINSNYKLYMRHYKGIPAWETEYIFVPEK